MKNGTINKKEMDFIHLYITTGDAIKSYMEIYSTSRRNAIKRSEKLLQSHHIKRAIKDIYDIAIESEGLNILNIKNESEALYFQAIEQGEFIQARHLLKDISSIIQTEEKIKNDYMRDDTPVTVFASPTDTTPYFIIRLKVRRCQKLNNGETPLFPERIGNDILNNEDYMAIINELERVKMEGDYDGIYDYCYNELMDKSILLKEYFI